MEHEKEKGNDKSILKSHPVRQSLVKSHEEMSKVSALLLILCRIPLESDRSVARGAFSLIENAMSIPLLDEQVVPKSKLGICSRYGRWSRRGHKGRIDPIAGLACALRQGRDSYVPVDRDVDCGSASAVESEVPGVCEPVYFVVGVGGG